MWSLIRLWSRLGNLMLVTSAVMRKELGEHACSKLDVWMRGVDTELFNPKHRSAEFKARAEGRRERTRSCRRALRLQCLAGVAPWRLMCAPRAFLR